MEEPAFDPSPRETHAPYREPAARAPLERRAARVFVVAGGVLLLVTLALTAMSLEVLETLTRFRSTAPRADASHVDRSEPFSVAIHQLASRNALPVFIAPDVDPRVLRTPVLQSHGDSLRTWVRALDAFAATKGLWVHVDDGVLRIEQEVRTVDLDCDGAVADCATRLERHASIVLQDPPRDGRAIHLRLRRPVPTVEAVRAALVAAGYDVDVVGRTVSFLAPPPAPVAEAPSATDPTLVQRVSRHLFVVSRRALDVMLQSQAAMMQATRVLPAERDGRVIGVRILLRRGSLLTRLGLETDDVLVRVNGLEIASPAQCLEAYQRTRLADVFALEIERDGRPMTLVYEIG